MANKQQMANAIRALAMDAVQQANSGHPGAPMGMADMAVALWGDHLQHNPKNPHWANRDRFVLSNGHASMLIYALLHLTGYKLPIDELKKFRQLHSKTAGHPEVGVTPGVETTTGPLGQGITNAVGMALAEKPKSPLALCAGLGTSHRCACRSLAAKRATASELNTKSGANTSPATTQNTSSNTGKARRMPPAVSSARPKSRPSCE